MRVRFYKSKNGWRWRVTASNGRIIANCGQGYSRRIDCVRGLFKLLEANIVEA